MAKFFYKVYLKDSDEVLKNLSLSSDLVDDIIDNYSNDLWIEKNFYYLVYEPKYWSYCNPQKDEYDWLILHEYEYKGVINIRKEKILKLERE